MYVFFPLLAMIKTRKLNKFIKRLSRRFPRFWRAFWTVGIFVSFGFMIFAYYFFFVNLINLILNPSIENVVTPLIPGVTIGFPVFAYLIIPLLFIMTTHELAHGIAASSDGVEIKSTGILGAGLFYLIGFGAFVEVDERELNSTKYSRGTRLRIASAGAFINALTLLLAVILMTSFPLMISPFYGKQVAQVEYVLTPEEGGYNYGNISAGDVIVALKKKGSTGDFVYLDGENGITLNYFLGNNHKTIKFSVGDKVILKIYVPRGDLFCEKEIILGPLYDENNKIIGVFIGIQTSPYYMPLNFLAKLFTGKWPIFLFTEFLWLWIIAFSVTIFNLVGLPIFDGDRMIKEIMNWLIGSKYKRIKKKKDQLSYNKESNFYYLSEMRVSEIEYVKIFLPSRGSKKNRYSDALILNKNYYRLVDKIGDGFMSTLELIMPETASIEENTLLEVGYTYWHDENKAKRQTILNAIRFITLFLVVGNFLLSYLKFGMITFWI
ncbi:MAG: site-2 protease family protein [Promethearchaeota archaeon]